MVILNELMHLECFSETILDFIAFFNTYLIKYGNQIKKVNKQWTNNV